MDRAFESAFRFTKPFAVAVEGHAIAGGLVISMCADFIALGSGDYQVGLTELAVGIPFPRIAWEIVRLGVSPRALRKLVNEAGTHSPEEVFELGVGDVVTDDPVGAARSWLALTTSRPLKTFQFVKALRREEAWRRIDDYRVRERATLLETLLETRRGLE
jgi:enoyl-CoA hydratase